MAFKVGLLSRATTVIRFAPVARLTDLLNDPSGASDTGTPFTVTEKIPLGSVAVPLTVMVFTETTLPFTGCVIIRSGGLVSGWGMVTEQLMSELAAASEAPSIRARASVLKITSCAFRFLSLATVLMFQPPSP
jgi:hypothetical protein